MKVGNIVSNKKINVSDDFNVVESLDKVIQGLPTLLIGWDYVNKHFPDNDVLNKKVSDDISWTFARNERRGQHEEDLYYFVKEAYQKLISDITYIFVDPILFTKKTLKKVIRKIYSLSKTITYQHDNMIYIYGDKLIFGIDLDLLDFIGYNVDKIIQNIKKKTHVFLQKNDIFIEYKNRVEILENQFKYIPYLYSIEHG